MERVEHIKELEQMIPREQWRRKNNPLLRNAVMKQLRGRE